RGSVEGLPLRDASVDLIFSRVVLPYVHQGRTMAEFGRVLVPGGRALLVLHGPGFYGGQNRRCGLRPRPGAEAYPARGGLAGGLAFAGLGIEPRWRSRRGRFYLSYQTQKSFTRLAARSGLRVDHWEDNDCKPIAWLSRPA